MIERAPGSCQITRSFHRDGRMYMRKDALRLHSGLPSALEHPIECRGGDTELCSKLPACDVIGLQVDLADEFAGVRWVVHRYQ